MSILEPCCSESLPLYGSRLEFPSMKIGEIWGVEAWKHPLHSEVITGEKLRCVQRCGSHRVPSYLLCTNYISVSTSGPADLQCIQTHTTPCASKSQQAMSSPEPSIGYTTHTSWPHYASDLSVPSRPPCKLRLFLYTSAQQ